MAATADFELPTYEDITVQELNVPFSLFLAMGHYMGKQCYEQSNEYWMCKLETKNPRTCLKSGKDLTACGLEFMQNLKKHCREQVEEYGKCITRTSSRYSGYHCKDYEGVMDKCILEKMNITKPPDYYYLLGRTHRSERPRPKMEIPDFPNESRKLEKDRYPQESRHGPKTPWGR